jgi:hypothetical protein
MQFSSRLLFCDPRLAASHTPSCWFNSLQMLVTARLSADEAQSLHWEARGSSW